MLYEPLGRGSVRFTLLKHAQICTIIHIFPHSVSIGSNGIVLEPWAWVLTIIHAWRYEMASSRTGAGGRKMNNAFFYIEKQNKAEKEAGHMRNT